MFFGIWRHASTFMKTGDTFVKMDRVAGDREGVYKVVVAGLGRMFEGLARAVAEQVCERIGAGTSALRVLDVGCGSGVWGLALAERVAGAHVTGLDLPAVLANFEERARGLGLSARTSTLPGDMHETKLPSGAFDLSIIANVLRLESEDRAASLVRRVAESVTPGGSLLIVDALAGGTRAKDIGRTVYAYHLAMRSEGGKVHTPDTVAGWLRAAGFSRIEPIDLDAAGHGALLARR
jgi:ubiquinone/menaquinone biosynthesis C-methylase UbiE